MNSFDKQALKAAAVAVVGTFDCSDHCAAGSVAAALQTAAGDIFTGICIDTHSSLGFCAEHAAIADMLKHRQTHISAIVAVNIKGEIIPPCGRCRELIRQVDEKNWSANVLVDEEKAVVLSDLMPFATPVRAAPSVDR